MKIREVRTRVLRHELPEAEALNPPKRAGDVVDVPTGPGLGLEIDRAVLDRYRA